MIRVGRIVRPHGIRGMVAVNLEDPESESLFGVGHVYVAVEGQEPVRRPVRRSAPGRRGQVLLHLEGMETPEAAETLRDSNVLLEESQLPALEEGEFWFRDLLTLRAIDEKGAELGDVTEVVDTADVPVLVVKGSGGEIFVPFTEPYVLDVNVRERRVLVAPPEMVE